MRIVLALVAVLAGCAEPQSVLVHRPGDARADAAVTKLWAGEIHDTARDGDWILTRSYYAMADVIASTLTTEQLSHALIYDHEHDTVIEGDADRARPRGSPRRVASARRRSRDTTSRRCRHHR